MPGDPTSPAPDEDSVLSGAAADKARDCLLDALRAARSAAVQAGADPDAVTADLQERVRRVRRLRATEEDEPAPGDG